MAPTPQHEQGTVATVAPPPAPASVQPQDHKPISIRSYRPEDHAAVLELFAAGMLYYAEGTPEAKQVWVDYVAQSITEDLADIQGTYFTPGGHFWVATADEDGKEVVVGMVAIEAKPGNEGELRRMSVKAEYRRYGVGRLLVSHLEQWATTQGYAKVWLSTGGPMVQAQKFYKSINYNHFKTEVYSQDPYFEVVYFEKAFV